MEKRDMKPVYISPKFTLKTIANHMKAERQIWKTAEYDERRRLLALSAFRFFMRRSDYEHVRTNLLHHITENTKQLRFSGDPWRDGS